MFITARIGITIVHESVRYGTTYMIFDKLIEPGPINYAIN